ncbi:MAG: fumarate reductase cytochrome b subunit [Deltaproteobacteria bacterium]|nr:fumarate reductase cytochrome b subunit [Deltaproteobacteria bacterium]
MEQLLSEQVKKSRTPARLDFYQSATGLILGLFMWAHMLLVSSILLGNESMYWVAKSLEASFLSKDPTHGYPILVTFAVLGVFFLFIVHAGLAVRKFPSSWKQHRVFRSHMKMMKHKDTNIWYTQVVTGFIMFFFGSVHLYIMMTHPDKIGPYASSDRFVSDWMWPLYLILLLAVEAHGTIGLYRLAVKWGWFDGKNPVSNRKKLKFLKNLLAIFFIVLGLFTFAAYVKIGIEHRDKQGERYIPSSLTSQAKPEALINYQS